MKLAGNLACSGALAMRPWVRRSGTLFACWVLTATLCVGGEFNPTLNLGDAAPAWEKLPGTDDQQHSLADLAGKDILLVPLLQKAFQQQANGTDLISQPTNSEVRNELSALIDRLVTNGATSANVAKGACAAALGSGALSIL